MIALLARGELELQREMEKLHQQLKLIDSQCCDGGGGESAKG